MKKVNLSFLLAFLMLFVCNDIVGFTCYNIDTKNMTCTIGKSSSINLEGELVIPETITITNYTGIFTVVGITSHGFSECKKITSVTLPSTITSIGNAAFQYCTSLTSVTLSNSLTLIDGYAFFGCASLKSIVLPNSLTTIGTYAFNGCTSLASIIMPNSLSSIGSYAFGGCTSINSIKFEEGICEIGKYAFSGCKYITSISIPSTLTTFGEGAFENCSSVSTVDITDVGSWCSSNFYDFSSCPLSENCILLLNGKQINKVVIPDGTTQIAKYAFYNQQNITQVEIPSSVTSIGKSAFYNCTGLLKADIPDNVTSIGSYAFYNCNGLVKVNLPEPLESIGDYAFYNCSGFVNVDFKNELKTIGEYAFCGCSGIPYITLPSSITSIGRYAFSKCSSLSKVTFNDSDESVNCGNWVFDNCSNIKDVYVGKDLTGQYVLNKSSITNITIGDKVTKIIDNAFANASITELTIPASVTSIGGNSFNYCNKLTKVTLKANVNSTVFSNLSGIKEVIITDDVNTIYSNAFKGCKNLETVSVGKNVEYIRDNAFANCSKLKNFNIAAAEPPYCYSDVFTGASISTAILQAPSTSLNKYKATEPWSGFGTYEAFAGEGGSNICAKPTISFEGGKLHFACNTDGAEVISTINDADINTHIGNEVELTATYEISAYATKAGYDNSETATATLVWLSYDFTTEGVSSHVSEIKARPVLVSSNMGNVTLSGLNDGETVDIYDLSGKRLTSATSHNDSAMFNVEPNQIIVVKSGDKAFKVKIK